MKNKSFWLFQCVSVLAVIVVAGCTTNSPAPIENRTNSGVATPDKGTAPVAVARQGYHIVKRGETLYSIATQYGQDFKDVAAWNKIDNPSVLAVGQELRVVPPGSAAGAVGGSSAVGAPSIESRPMEGTAVVKTDPKGGRVDYSAQAWNDLNNANSNDANGVKPAIDPAKTAPVAPAGSETVDWMWPASGKLIAGFSEASNKGLDISGNTGDPVLAASAGKVVYAGSGLRGYGNLVIVKHNDTFLSAYAHNSEVLVKEGQSVKKGQKIATMGNSDTDRTKLHFEIRKQGKPVDPSKYLPPR